MELGPMGENRCNRCVFEDIEKLAQHSAGQVLITMKKDHELGGYDIHILYPHTAEPAWAHWMLTLPNLCCCGN